MLGFVLFFYVYSLFEILVSSFVCVVSIHVTTILCVQFKGLSYCEIEQNRNDSNHYEVSARYHTHCVSLLLSKSVALGSLLRVISDVFSLITLYINITCASTHVVIIHEVV